MVSPCLGTLESEDQRPGQQQEKQNVPNPPERMNPLFILPWNSRHVPDFEPGCQQVRGNDGKHEPSLHVKLENGVEPEVIPTLVEIADIKHFASRRDPHREKCNQQYESLIVVRIPPEKDQGDNQAETGTGQQYRIIQVNGQVADKQQDDKPEQENECRGSDPQNALPFPPPDIEPPSKDLSDENEEEQTEHGEEAFKRRCHLVPVQMNQPDAHPFPGEMRQVRQE